MTYYKDFGYLPESQNFNPFDFRNQVEGHQTNKSKHIVKVDKPAY